MKVYIQFHANRAIYCLSYLSGDLIFVPKDQSNDDNCLWETSGINSLEDIEPAPLSTSFLNLGQNLYFAPNTSSSPANGDYGSTLSTTPVDITLLAGGPVINDSIGLLAWTIINGAQNYLYVRKSGFMMPSWVTTTDPSDDNGFDIAIASA